MRLYTRTGATALDDPEFGHFEADDQGGFDFPDDLSDRLHAFHTAGRPLWETDIERQNRLINEELERRKDPATLLSAVEQLVKAASAVSPVVKAVEPEVVEKAEDSEPEGDDDPEPEDESEPDAPAVEKRRPGRPRKTTPPAAK